MSFAPRPGAVHGGRSAGCSPPPRARSRGGRRSLALGVVGGFAESNAVLGRAMRDGDPVVRAMAESAAGPSGTGPTRPRTTGARGGPPADRRCTARRRRGAGHPPDRKGPAVRRGLQSEGHRPVRPGSVRRRAPRIVSTCSGSTPITSGPLGAGPVPAPDRQAAGGPPEPPAAAEAQPYSQSISRASGSWRPDRARRASLRAADARPRRGGVFASLASEAFHRARGGMGTPNPTIRGSWREFMNPIVFAMRRPLTVMVLVVAVALGSVPGRLRGCRSTSSRT